jgi:1A family penicillin-binding protein
VSRRSRLRRQHGHTPASKIFLRVAVVTLGVTIVLALAGAATAAAAVSYWLKDLPDYKSPTAFQVAQPTKIYSADGKLLAKLYLQNREVVPLSQMASSVTSGVVAVEDERFFQHGGVDPWGILRAAFATSSGDRQGASTITQQYIRATILLDERTKMTLARKVREAYLAIQIEKQLSKSQILENYLNTVYFGEGAYGVEAAAQTYFAKSAKDLTLPEGALIAGIAQSPSRLDPYVNPRGAIARRKAVLDRMLVNGYITQADHDSAVAAPLALKRSNEPLNGIYAASYYVAYVKKLLQQQFSAGTVFNGGLTVYTTLDTRMQDDAEAAALKDYSGKKDPAIALVSIDPRTGYIKAMVGGRNYAQSKFNMATQGHRQPGSSFKTFVLVTAISQGMDPTYEVDSNAPVKIPAKPNAWVVNNDEGHGSGMMSLEEATWNSVNAVYARVAYYGVGIKNVAHTAKIMGIQTPIPNYPSIALGSVNCTPLEMASAYGTLATNGVHYSSIAITKVLDRNGQTIFQADPHGSQVIKASVAHATTDVLRGVISQGTATRANIDRPAAGKTGTSQNNRDAWFVGYTPQLVTAVWIGYPTERTIEINGQKGFGGTLAAPVWAAFMKKALAGLPARDFADAPDPNYDDSKFDIPVSDETKNATYAASKQNSSSSNSSSNSDNGSGGGSSSGSKKKSDGSGGSNKGKGGSGGTGGGGGGGGSNNTSGTGQ